MKYVARFNGWELCPYCHQFLRAVIRHNIRVVAYAPGRDWWKYWIHIIYSNTYHPVQNKIVPFFKDTPVILLEDTLYMSPAHWTMTDRFLSEYFRKKWEKSNRKV